MDIFFSAIFVCASPAISHVRADVNQVLDTTKGFIAHILFTGGSEGPFLRDSTPTKGYLLPEPSEEALEDVTYKLPSRVVVANSSEQDSTGHGKEVYTAESRTINEERSTKLEYSGDMISSTQGTHSGPGADSSLSKSVSAVRASSERIFSSDRAKNRTSPPATRDFREVQGDTDESTYSLGDPFHFNRSYPAKESGIKFGTINVPLTVEPNMDTIHTVQNQISYRHPKAATEHNNAHSLSLASLGNYPLNNTNYATKSGPSYLLRSLANRSLRDSFPSPAANYSLPTSSSNLSPIKRSLGLQNKNVTSKESLQLFANFETIPHPSEESNDSFRENMNDARVSSLRVNKTTEQYEKNDTLQMEHLSTYLTDSPQTTPSEYVTTPTESEYQSDTEESKSVTTEEYPGTTESLLLTKQEASDSTQYEDFVLSQEFRDELTTLSGRTPFPYTTQPNTYPFKGHFDHLLFPTNNDDNDTLSKETDMEQQAKNITSRNTENIFLYSNEDNSDTTYDYENIFSQSNYDFDSTNSSDEVSSFNPTSSDTNSLFDVPRPSDTVITSSAEKQSDSATEVYIDPVSLESEEFNSLEQSVPVNTSEISTYPSENPIIQLVDKMLNKSAVQWTRYHSSLQNKPEHIISVKGLEVASVLKFSNQPDELYHLKQNITISTSISLQSKNTSQTNNDQVPQNSTIKPVTFESIISQNDTLAFSELASESYISETSTYASDDPLSSLSIDEDDAMSTPATEKFDETLSVDFNIRRGKLISLHSENNNEISTSEEIRQSTYSDYQSEEVYHMNENDSFVIESENQLGFSANILLDESTYLEFTVSSDQPSTTAEVKESSEELQSEYYSTEQTEAAPEYSAEDQASTITEVTEPTTDLLSEYYSTDQTEVSFENSTKDEASTTNEATKTTAELQNEYYLTDQTEAVSEYSTEDDANITSTVTKPSAELQSEYYSTDQTEAASQYSTEDQASTTTEVTEPSEELQSEYYPTHQTQASFQNSTEDEASTTIEVTETTAELQSEYYLREQTEAVSEYSAEDDANNTSAVTEPSAELQSEYYFTNQIEAASENSTEDQASTTSEVAQPTTDLQSEYYSTDQTEYAPEYSTDDQTGTTTEATRTTAELQSEYYPIDQTEASFENSTEDEASTTNEVTEPSEELQREYYLRDQTEAVSEYSAEGETGTTIQATETSAVLQSEYYSTDQREYASEYSTEGQAGTTTEVKESSEELQSEYYPAHQTQASFQNSTGDEASTTIEATETTAELQSEYYLRDQTEAVSEYSAENDANTTSAVTEPSAELQSEYYFTNQIEAASENSTEDQASTTSEVAQPTTDLQSEYYSTDQTEYAPEYSTDDQTGTTTEATETTAELQSEYYPIDQTEASFENLIEDEASTTNVVTEPSEELQREYYLRDQTTAVSEFSAEGQTVTTPSVIEPTTQMQTEKYPTDQTEAASEYSTEGEANTTTAVAESATELQNETSSTHQSEPAFEYSTKGQTSIPLLVTEPTTETQSEYYPLDQTEAISEFSIDDISERYLEDLVLLSGGDFKSDIVDYMDENSTVSLSLLTLSPDESDKTTLLKTYQNSRSVVNPSRTRSIANSLALLAKPQGENLLFSEEVTADDPSEEFTYTEEMTSNLHSADIGTIAIETTTSPAPAFHTIASSELVFPLVTNANPITFASAKATDVPRRNISHAAELPKIAAPHPTDFTNEWKYPSSNMRYDWRNATYPEGPSPNTVDINNNNFYYLLPTFVTQNTPLLRELLYNYLEKFQSPWPYNHYNPHFYQRISSLPASYFNQNAYYHWLLQAQRYYYYYYNQYYQGSYAQNPAYQQHVPWQSSPY